MRRHTSWWRRGAVVAAAVTATLSAVPGTTASAHPFGPPLRAEVAVEASTVTVAFRAAEDDWVILADHVGAFADPAGASLDPDATLPTTGAERLAASAELRGYLLDHIEVGVAGPDHAAIACPGEVSRLTTDVVTDGAELAFRCPQEAEALELSVTVLTDLHEAYRVLTTSPSGWGPDQLLFTAASPRATVTAGAGGAAGVPWVGAGLGVTGLAAVVLVTRRLQRRDPEVTTQRP